MVDQKISDFPAITTINDADSFPAIQGGVNVKMAWQYIRAAIQALVPSFTGNNSYSGTNTFTHATTPIKTDKIAENISTAGVTVDGVLLKDGMAVLSGTPTVNGQVGYISNQFKGQRNGTVKNFLMEGDSGFPKNYIAGPAPIYASAATITLPAGMCARDSANTADISVGSDITLSLATSGASGLDAGSEASSTWYYVYLIKKSSDGTVSAVFSTVNEAVTGSITLPSGYDLKRQLPMAVRNDGSSNIIPFAIHLGWPYKPLVLYSVSMTYFNGSSTTAGTTNVVAAGTASTYTSVSLASFVPPISQMALMNTFGTASAYANLRAAGETHEGRQFGSNNNNTLGGQFFVPTNSSQAIEYKKYGGTSVHIDVQGYFVTGVA